MTRQSSKPLSNDAALVERLRAGDASAVADLSQRYGAKIFQLAFRYMKNREDAEEVAQDVLLKVFKKIKASAATRRCHPGSTGSRSTPRCRGCGRCASRGRRKCRSARSPCSDGDEMESQRVDVADWLAHAGRDLSCARSCGIASTTRWIELPSIYRTPIVLRDIQGLSTEEASALLKRQEPDAEVAPASRPAGAARAALGVRGRRRPAPRRVRRPCR